MSDWPRYQRHYLPVPEVGAALDISRMAFPDDFLETMEPAVQRAFDAMAALEAGAVANPDEDRQVGHYWLRAPGLAPDAATGEEIEAALAQIRAFAREIHESGAYRNLLVVGIGGSALGPQFVSEALGPAGGPGLAVHFFDNTDPDGMARTLARLEGELDRTLTVVISKSGGTPETRNGMVEARAAYAQAGVEFAPHAVAVTGAGSQLDQTAEAEGWKARFPMWDWVGGRTSELGPVGLLPAALEGFDIDALLRGAAQMDEVTRRRETANNPAALLALMWHFATGGRGAKDMVILPYKDRLQLFAKYLQQLVMESLGKELDLDGKVVNQGIAVYGNKGSTDQHAYVQQLRDGVDNFFVTFIEVLEDRGGASPAAGVKVDGDGNTSGDYLNAFLLGTRAALWEKGRGSVTLTIDAVDAERVGALIALFERAVGLYASLVNINAYHQPGVEAGKRAATATLALKGALRKHLRAHPGEAFTAESAAAAIGQPDEAETVFKLLQHLAANAPHSGIERRGDGAGNPFEATYRARGAGRGGGAK